MSRLAFVCRDCGVAGSFTPSPDVLWRRVALDVENAHAAQHPECPYNRDRLTITVELSCP